MPTTQYKSFSPPCIPYSIRDASPSFNVSATACTTNEKSKRLPMLDGGGDILLLAAFIPANAVFLRFSYIHISHFPVYAFGVSSTLSSSPSTKFLKNRCSSFRSSLNLTNAFLLPQRAAAAMSLIYS